MKTKQSLQKITAALALISALAFAQDGGAIDFSGSVQPGAQLFTVKPDSSKFNEYRDIEDGFYLYGLGIEAFDLESGRFGELRARNLFRDDHNVQARLGKYGHWNLGLEWDEIPHLLSNKARTPYAYQGSGVFTLPSTIADATPGLVKDLSPGSGPQTSTNDPAIAAFMAANVKPTKLENDRKKGTATFEYSLIEDLRLKLSFSNENRDGNKVTYGPIGDRPPRSLNIQLPEPIDYRSQEFKAETEYKGDWYLVGLAYQLSSFRNNVDAMRWQNMYTLSTASAANGTAENWDDTGTNDPNVALYGLRALPPDNKYQSGTLVFRADLPLDSTLGATASFGRMTQNADLIPYSYNGTVHTAAGGGNDQAWNDLAKLPRTTADARINTKLLNVDYSIRPMERVDARAFYRFYDHDNNTAMTNWWYVTSDTVHATNGRPSYKNKRTNLPYGYDQQNYGVDLGYSLSFWRTRLGLGYEREGVDRDYREANTQEDIYRVSLRSRPVNWLSLRTKYQYGKRDMKDFNPTASSAGYWYVPADSGTDKDDPKFTFDNHPDTRRYDLSDRKRNAFDFIASANPLQALDLSGSYRYRKDDFDSKVAPSAPLANYAGGSTAIDATRRGLVSPGNQIGLLNNRRHQYGLDAGYALTERLNVSAFYNRDDMKAQQRGFEYQENNKVDPDTQNAADLGGWNRASNQWDANIKDRTHTVGLGFGYVVIPGKLKFNANQTYSQGKIDIEYSGFGLVKGFPAGGTNAPNYQFFFQSPDTVLNDRLTVGATVEYEVIQDMTVGLGYMYERYKVQDWQQEPNQPWTEQFGGSENVQRDTARSERWGNRLPHLGNYLAPSYVAHVGSVSMTYRF